MLIIGILCYSLHMIQCKTSSDEETSFSWNRYNILPIEHAFGTDDQYQSRGQISFKMGRTLTSSFVDNHELSNDEIEKLKTLAENDGLYFIRAPIRVGGSLAVNENGTTQYVSTFVKACYLYGSQLTEYITVSVDFVGNVIGISIASPRSNCNGMVCNGIFNSTVLVNQQVMGPVPETQAFVKKIEQEKADQAQGKGKDNRSFFAKYWMYIIPVVLVFMLSAQAEPEGGGGNES